VDCAQDKTARGGSGIRERFAKGLPCLKQIGFKIVYASSGGMNREQEEWVEHTCPRCFSSEQLLANCRLHGSYPESGQCGSEGLEFDRIVRHSETIPARPGPVMTNRWSAVLVYQRFVRLVTAKYRKLEAGSSRNQAYQIIWFGTRSWVTRLLSTLPRFRVLLGSAISLNRKD